MQQKRTAFFSSPFFQPFTWTVALLLLYFMNVDGPSLCLFRFVGWERCIGCGLGHAIHDALHGQWTASWEAHPMGLPATIALLYMIIKPFLTNKNHHHGFQPNADDASRRSTRRSFVYSKPDAGAE
ncbi:MAG: DUF2752 domain-containing protein [Flavisolibacter sp.]